MTISPKQVSFYQPSSYRLEESIGYLKRRITTSIIQSADKRLAHCGLTSAQWAPLFKIMIGRRPTVAELSRQVNLDAGSMTRLLDRLERKGLCRRVRSAEDRRIVHIELTHEGEMALRDVPAVLSDVLNAHLAGFDERKWRTLLDYLRRMVDNCEAIRASEIPTLEA